MAKRDEQKEENEVNKKMKIDSDKASERKEDGGSKVLKKWLEGDDAALKEWLGEEKVKEGVKKIEEIKKEEIEKEKEFESLKGEIAELNKIIAKRLGKIETGDYDPMKLLGDIAKANTELQMEIRRRKEMEEEVEHIKKGSIAVIRYMKARKMRGEELQILKKKLTDEKAGKVKVEEQLKKMKRQLDKKISELPEDKKVLMKGEIERANKEAELKAKEEELRDLEEKLRSAVDKPGVADEELEQRLHAELMDKDEEFLAKENKLKKRIIELEESIEKLKIDEKLRKEELRLRSKGKEGIDEELIKKERELRIKEKSILLREDEIERLKEDGRIREEELKKIKETVGYKEDELLRREEDMLYRENKFASERKKLEEMQREIGGVKEHELKKRLEELKGEITKKEEEVRTKERYLDAKMEELRLREHGVIEEEIEAKEKERMLEIKQEKVTTGTQRLDDLLFGGIPFGINVAIYGPAFTGKEIILNNFIADGLKKGVPAIYVLTDKMPSNIREEMKYIISGYEEYEKIGLIKYVDAYSKSMGEIGDDPYTIYIDQPSDYKELLKAVDDLASGFKKKYKYYRIGFRTISTLTAYSDVTTTFRFLQPFVGRRKRDKAVSMYVLEKGMHGEQEIQTLGSAMDGMIDLKVEKLKTFLCVKGIGDVQSRAYIRYTYSKQGVNIGSFALDHIR